MRVFVTGATGFVGSALVPELIDAGHQVLGLARNDAGAQSLAAAGAQVHRGDVENLESLRTGAANADAVIHTAFIHDFSKFQESCEIDRKAIETLGDALAGSDRLFIVTSGLALVAKGRAATEQDLPVPVSASYPRASEEAAAALEARGVRTIVMRLSQIHDTVKQGLVTYAIQIARQKGVSAYIGDGLTALPRLPGSIPRGCIRWRWKKETRAPGIMQSQKRACRCERSLKPSVKACTFLWFRSRRRRPLSTLAGSHDSQDWTSRPQARKRGKSWDGIPRGPA